MFVASVKWPTYTRVKTWEVFKASVNCLLTQGKKAVAWYVKSKFIGRWGKDTVFIPGCKARILTYWPMGP